MTLVVPCYHLENVFMVLLISELAKIGATNLIFWILVPLRGEGGSCMRGHGLLSLYSSYTKFKAKNSIFFVSNSDMLPNYLRTYSSALCQIRALEKAL